MKLKLFIFLAVLGTSLLAVSAAFADGAASSQYGSCVGATCNTGAALPFTGLAVGVMFALGIGIIMTGVLMRYRPIRRAVRKFRR